MYKPLLQSFEYYRMIHPKFPVTLLNGLIT